MSALGASRRAQATLLCIALGIATCLHLRAQTFDLVIANGRVLDPESGLDAVRNIGVTGRKVVTISSDRLTGRQMIDAAGLVVAPGFIDVHAHGQTPETYEFQARDGVTTALELEVGTEDVPGWYAQRTGKALINHGVTVSHPRVRMKLYNDKGDLLPSGPGAHTRATAAGPEPSRSVAVKYGPLRWIG